MSVTASSNSTSIAVSSTKRTSYPVVFLTHGGSATYFMELPPTHPFYNISSKSISAQWLRDFTKLYNLKDENAPKGIVVVSAHWETQGAIKVTAQKQHSKLQFGYRGIQFNPPGDLALSNKVVSLLKAAGVQAETDSNWNFDHGVYGVMKMMWPDAEVPVVEMSIDHGWDPAFHLKVGDALKPLRKEGYLLICSGSSTHNFNPDGKANAEFMQELTRLVESPSITPEERIRKTVLEWTKLPKARIAHPAEDHFVPYFIAVGAAEGKPGKMVGKVEPAGDWCMASYMFE